jgi:hypothetical protein
VSNQIKTIEIIAVPTFEKTCARVFEAIFFSIDKK